MSHTKKLVLARDRICNAAERMRAQREALAADGNVEAAAAHGGVVEGLNRAAKIVEQLMRD